MDLWNKKYLDPPPTHTIQVKNRNLDLQSLLYIISEAEEIFINEKYLEADAALLSRCIYRMKMKFRSDKGFKALEKTNRALLQYRYLDSLNMLKNFKELMPSKYNNDNIYLPALNMVDYVLVRMQGLSKLLCRIGECAKTAGYFLENRIYIGHLWKVAFIAFGIVSRIFVISRYYTKYCCRFYNELLKLRPHFKNLEFEWLPKDYVFPEKLDEWLDVDWLESTDVLKLPTQKSFAMYNFEEDSDLECSGEYVEIDEDLEIIDQYIDITKDINPITEIKDDLNQINLFTTKIVKDVTNIVKDKKIKKTKIKTKANIINHKPVELFMNIAEDVGEIIIETNKNIKKKKSKTKPNIDAINSVEDLKDFMQLEEKLRSKNSGLSNFKHLGVLEWNMLNHLLDNLMSKANKKSMSQSIVHKAKAAMKMKIK